MVKKCIGLSNILTEDKINWGNNWNDGQDGKINNKQTNK